MIVALVSQKGGCGKSTLAISLAVEWHRRGFRTLLVDADPQGTALAWGEVAAEKGRKGPTVIAMGDNLRADLPGLSKGYEVTVIDTPGRQSKRTIGALVRADLALIPCGPSPADLWALGETVELVQGVEELRPDLLTAIVVNGDQKRTALSKATKKAVAAAGYPVLGASLGQRVAFAEAVAAGKGVTSIRDGGMAANELRRVADEIESMIEEAKGEGAAHVA